MRPPTLSGKKLPLSFGKSCLTRASPPRTGSGPPSCFASPTACWTVCWTSGVARHPFYADKRWTDKRERILRRDLYLCQACKRYGRSTQASTVHHIIPLHWCLSNIPALALASDNLLSLCASCHDQIHARQTDTLTENGCALVDRMYGNDKPVSWTNRAGE